MLLFDPHYLQKIRVTLESAMQIDVAVAFWGTGADRLFANTEVKIRIVCNLLSGGTNPEPIELLQARANVEVRQSSVLHAKLLLTDRDMIIGSANFSTNGLHYETDELQGWKELGVATQDESAITAAKSWFEELWAQSNTIEKTDLERAKLAWGRARNHRSIRDTGGASGSLPKRTEMVDRPIYLAIWGQDASSQAETEFEETKRQHLGELTDTSIFDFYEDWPELPKNASLIDVYLGPRHGVHIGGVWRRVPELDRNFNRKNGEGGSIQVVTSENVAQELPFAFNTDFRKSLRKRLISESTRPLLKISASPLLSDLLE